VKRNALTVLVFVLVAMAFSVQQASAAWTINGDSYQYRYRIGSSATAGWPFNVNGTYNPPGWTQNASSLFQYCEISGCATGKWTIADGSASQLNYEVDNGTDVFSGYNPSLVWNDANLKDVWHFKNATGFDSKFGTTTLTVASGAPSSISALYGNGAHTDGIDDTFQNTSFSISGDHTWLLIYRKDNITTNTYDRVLTEYDNTGNGQNGCFLFSAIGAYNNRWAIGCWSQSESAMSPVEINVGSWYCLAMKKNSTGYSLYVNGSLIAANTQSTTTINTVQLGTHYWSGAYHNFANGTYDDIRYYTDDLTDAQIADACKDMNNQLSTTGAEETSGAPPSVTFYDPANSTYYGIYNTTVKFVATDVESPTFMLKAWLNGAMIYNSASYTGGTNVTLAEQLIQAGGNNLTVWVNDTDSNEAVSSRFFYVFMGLNLSAFNSTGQAVATWNLNLTNGTAANYSIGISNGFLVEYKTLDGSPWNISANATAAFDSQTFLVPMNSTMGFIARNFTLYQFEYFTGKDYDTGSNISTIIIFTNGTANYTVASATRHAISLRVLPFGSAVTATYTASGYNNSVAAYDINLSSYIDASSSLIPAGVLIKAYNEENPAEQLTFNWLMSNGSAEVSANDVTQIFLSYSALPQGFVRMNVWNASYETGGIYYTFPARSYFFTVSPYTSNRFNAYLLRSDAGFWQTFYTIDQDNRPVANAMITIAKSISSVETTVAQEQTNPAGAASIFLKPYVYYSLRLQSNGFLPIYQPIITFTPALNPQYIYMSAGTSTLPAFYNVFYGVQMSLSPTADYVSNVSSVTPSCSVFAQQGNILLSEFNVSRSYLNGTLSRLYSITSSDPSGNTFSYPGITQTGRYNIRCYVRISYNITNSTYETYATYKEKEFFYYAPTGMAAVGSGGLDAFTLELTAIVITTIIIVFLSAYAGIGAGFFGLVIEGLFLGLGWIPLFDYILTCLVFAAVVVLRYVVL
jgi:hypothetical protein